MAARVAGMVALWVAAVAALAGADFWEEKPFTAWSDKEVEQMLTDSPWSRRVGVLAPDLSLAGRVGGLSGGIVGQGAGSRSGVGAAGGGAGGAGAGNLGGGDFMPPPRKTQLTVRWNSALPVKQATLRRRLGREAELPAAAQTRLVEDETFYRIAVIEIPVELAQAGGTLRRLRERTLLKRKNKASITPVDIRLTYETDLLVIEFHFPRTDAITLDDREVEFVTIMNESEVKTTFQLKAMLFGGRLTL